MSEDQQQTVVENADAEATPGAEGADARIDDALETLLSEYDSAGQSATPDAAPQTQASEVAASQSIPEQQPGTVSEDSVLSQRLNNVETVLNANQVDEFNRQVTTDMNKVIKGIRGDLDAELYDDGIVDGWVRKQAKENPKLDIAWSQRHADPKQFEKVVATLGRKFHKKFSSLPDKQATEDKEAVTAAVRGSSTKAPENKPTNYSRLSDAEYRKSVIAEHGYDPMV